MSISDLFAQVTNTIDVLLLKYNEEYEKRSFSANILELNKILALAEKHRNDIGKSNVYRRLGILYKNSGDFERAINYYTRSLQISDSVSNYIASGSTCNNLAFIYYELNQVGKAIEFLKIALDYYEAEDFSIGIADVTGSLSEIFSEKNSFDTAIFFAEKSLYARKKLKDTSYIGYYYHSLGYLYDKKGDASSAKRLYDIALNRLSAADLVPTLNSIGNLYDEQKQYDSAIHYHRIAYDTADKYQNMPLLAESAFSLSKTYEAKGDTLEAFRFLKLASALNDSMLDSTTRKAIVDAERKYDSDAKTQKIELQAAVIKTNRLWMAVISVILLSVLIIAALWINNAMNRRRLAQSDAELQRSRVDELLQKHEVENVNSMLRGQDAERKRIAQELHDRLGSILATVKLHFSNVQDAISALQQQQTKSYTEANQLLDEACEEVRRISHDLYEGSLVKFGFKTALLQLIAAIEKANALRISFLDNNVGENHYKPFEKDLYRITQELLSNTLKYANARQVTIQFNLQPGKFVYTYEDDGKGFNPVELQAARGIGYKNIESRVGNTGGTWHVDSRPGHGMTVIIEIPVSDGNH